MAPATTDLQRIGRTIRDRRERAGLRQHQVAAAAGISLYHYGAIENGRNGASRITWLKIADALGMTVEEIDALIGEGEAA